MTFLAVKGTYRPRGYKTFFHAQLRLYKSRIRISLEANLHVFSFETQLSTLKSVGPQLPPPPLCKGITEGVVA